MRFASVYLVVGRAERPDEVPALPAAGAGVRRQVVGPAMSTKTSSCQHVDLVLQLH